MATTLQTSLTVSVLSQMVSTGGMTSTADTLAEQYAAQFTNGTGDGMADRHVHFAGSAAASPVTLDLYGSVTDKVGNTVNAVEVCGIMVLNFGTAKEDILTLGAGSNPAYSGLFKATGDGIIIPAGGPTGGVPFLWRAHYDGGGLTVTTSTADILTLDPGARTITYKVIIWYRTA